MTKDQEDDLAGRLIDIEKRLYGITLDDIRRLVFQYCELNNINHNLALKVKWLESGYKISFGDIQNFL